MSQDFLMWCGKGFYPSIDSFVEEASRLGCSKRINLIPRDIELGVSRVWLLHDNGITGKDPKTGIIRENIAKIFGHFVVETIDYVIDDDRLVESLRKKHRGIPIRRISDDDLMIESPRLSGRRVYGGLYLVGGPVMLLAEAMAYPYCNRKFRGFKRFTMGGTVTEGWTKLVQE